jgi:hypothetical protein
MALSMLLNILHVAIVEGGEVARGLSLRKVEDEIAH